MKTPNFLRLPMAALMLAAAGCQSRSTLTPLASPSARYAATTAKTMKSRSPQRPSAMPLVAPFAPCLDEAPPSVERYAPVRENAFVRTATQAVSTFGADVDTASYANLRRLIRQGAAVPPDAVRLEEMVNYFPYDYPEPDPGKVFAVRMETADCPWKSGDRLLRITLRTRDVAPAARPPANLVLLVDVSGSMDNPLKLPLVRKSLGLLADGLRPQDRLAIVTYAGSSGLALPSTPGDRRRDIREAIRGLRPGGSTNGSGGIQLAYQTAAAHFIPGGVNRVILATDGDFNVGITDEDALERLIAQKARSGVFLSVLGFGMGNLKDSTLERLADRGNGNYAYIDSLDEARKVLAAESSGTLLTVAKDVKLQLAWEPATARRWRLLGYENRVLDAEDFADDRRDSGDMGAGQRLTVLYQYEPAAQTGRLAELRIRHKRPESDRSTVAVFPCPAGGTVPFAAAGGDFRFAAAVAAFGMALRDSPHAGGTTRDSILTWAETARGRDPDGLRREFIGLVKRAKFPAESARIAGDGATAHAAPPIR